MGKNLLAGIAVVVALLCGVLVWSIWAYGNTTDTQNVTQQVAPATDTPINTTVDSMEVSTAVEIGTPPGTTASVEVIAE